MNSVNYFSENDNRITVHNTIVYNHGPSFQKIEWINFIISLFLIKNINVGLKYSC